MVRELGWKGGAEKTEARKQDRAEQAKGERTQTELGRGRRGWGVLFSSFPSRGKKKRGDCRMTAGSESSSLVRGL